MRPPAPIRAARRRLAAEEGFTLIEVLAAALILVVGLVGLIFSFDSARRLSLVSERQSAMAHVAQKELERLQAEPYSRLQMSSTPAHSSEKSSPDYYVTNGAEPKYQFDAESAATNEPLAIAASACTTSTQEECGGVPGTATAWSAGNSSGFIYDFVTWHADEHCTSGCKEGETKNYKRLTVVVTVTVPTNQQSVAPVKVSSFLANPNAVANGSVSSGDSNPLENPETKCGGVPCTTGLGKGNAQFWFLHDSPSSSALPVAPSANHTVHATIAATNSTCTAINTSVACPVPDLLHINTPAASTLYNYSSDLGVSTGESAGGEYAGGRVLKPGASCSTGLGSTQSAENSKGEMWVTDPVSAATKLTGYGGLSLYTQTVKGVAETVGLCVAVYDVPNSIANLLKIPPTRLGFSEYKPDAWPQELSNLAFTFEFTPTTIAAEHRIGVRIWTTSSSPAIAVAYDTLLDKSFLQLNTE